MTAEVREVGCRISDSALLEAPLQMTIRPGSAKRQLQVRYADVVQGAVKHLPLPHRQLEASAHLAAELCQA